MSDRRNAAIVVLVVTVAVLGLLLAGELRPGAAPEPVAVDGPSVTVVDVDLDREHLRRIEIVFDRPLGEDRVGQVLAAPPARLTPHAGGVWSWVATHVLRFDPSAPLVPAARYEIELDPERFAPAEYTFVGSRVFEVRTDAFQVERVQVEEEVDEGAAARVVLRGEIRFNYPVEPAELAAVLRLHDPLLDEPVPIELETTWAAVAVGWRSAPVEKGAHSRSLRLEIGRALTSRAGNVPLAADYLHGIPLGSRDVLKVRAVRAKPGLDESTLEIDLSSEVDPERARDYLEVKPSVAFRLSGGRGRLSLRGAFAPGSTVDLTLRAGLPGTDGATLPSEYHGEVRVPDLPPSIGFRGEGLFVSARGARRLGVETVNTDRLRLQIDRVYRNNVLYLVQQRAHQVWSQHRYGGISHVFGDRIADVELRVDAERNRLALTPVALDDHVVGEEPGFYRIAVGRPGSHAWQQRWLLVTDLGIVAKRGEDDLLVWVSSFADLTPRAGVRVRVVSDQNQPLARGRTDARGLLHLRGLREVFAEHRPAYVVAEYGDDWSFLPLDRTRIETNGLDVAGAPALGAGFDAFLYGERDLYRPGEVARGVVLLRDRDLGVPPPMPLLLRHRDPTGQERGTGRLELGAAGAAEFAHPISEIARTGAHTLDLLVGAEVVGSYRFHVEEFVPDRIAVSIAPLDAAPRPGAPLAYRIESAFLFGAPAAGLPVETEVHLEAASFDPPDHAGFVFENPAREFSARRLLRRESRLDDSGAADFEVALPAELAVPSSLTAVVTARVRERGGRGVAARTRLPVHPYARYVGLRRVGEGYAEPGDAVAFEYVTVDPEGGAVPSGRLRVELFRDEWQTVLRRTASGSFRFESELDPRLVDTLGLEAGSTGGRFELTPREYGRYRVVVTDLGSNASAGVSLFASGWGFAPWALENPGRVMLDLEKIDHASGDEAVVQVRAPFAGRLLLTVERDDVLHVETHTLAENTARIRLPVRAEWRPNVFITATLVRAADRLEPGAVGRAFGAVALDVDRARHRMEVEVEAPEQLRPRGPLELRVHTAPGASVTLAAVDEGVLQLVAQETPDPFRHFYRRRALGVRSHDGFRFLLPELRLEDESVPGGGRADAARTQFLRTEGIRRAEPVAFWSGPLVADATGLAVARFDLPDFQGALRVMAVAHAGRDFGSASASTRVRDPLVLLPTFPRFLSTGERLAVPVTLRNDTGAAGTFEVTLAVSGAARAAGPGRRELEIADGAEQTLDFAVETGDVLGEVRLSLHATGAGESVRSEARIALRAPLPDVTLEEVGVLDEAGVRLAGDGGGALRPGTLRRELRVGASPVVQLYGALRDLLHYPYGCLEQTTSRAFPLVYLAELARELEPELFEQGDPDGFVADAIARIGSMQLANGGFGLWPRGERAAPWASVYATHFLVEAGRAGHAVDAVRDPALGWLRKETTAKPHYSGPELERVVYALYVLARAGVPERDTLDFVRERHAAQLRPTSRVLLAAAYAAAGDPSQLDALARAVEDVDRLRRQTGGNLGSTTRNRSLLLLALLDVAPGDARIPRLAGRLARDALSERWNTQEASLALVALGQLHHAARGAEYRGTLRVGGEAVAVFESGAAAVFRGLPRAGAIEIELASERGNAPVYYALSLRGSPTAGASAPVSEGIELTRTFLDREGEALEDLRVGQGELVVARLRLRSRAGPLENLVVQSWLPAGFEVENPRLDSAETLAWVNDADLSITHVDVRDDRVLLFAELPGAGWRTAYVLLRAVTPGRFRLPPAQVEAMYEPSLRATGVLETFEVEARR